MGSIYYQCRLRVLRFGIGSRLQAAYLEVIDPNQLKLAYGDQLLRWGLYLERAEMLDIDSAVKTPPVIATTVVGNEQDICMYLNARQVALLIL